MVDGVGHVCLFQNKKGGRRACERVSEAVRPTDESRADEPEWLAGASRRANARATVKLERLGESFSSSASPFRSSPVAVEFIILK